MSRLVIRTLIGVASLALVLSSQGCTKNIPLPDGKFEAQQNVVLTLKDGRTIRGHIGPELRVEYRVKEATYRARVATVGNESIRLDGLILLDQGDSYSMVSQRLADARTQLTAPLPPVTFPRSDIERVDEVRFDSGRSIRKASFWIYGGALFVLLLGERS
jgi:hypothetical protein